jgi:hypothetical protein
MGAGLPLALTLAACRHGGLTELGDADLSEQGVMALSGHKTPQVALGSWSKGQKRNVGSLLATSAPGLTWRLNQNRKATKVGIRPLH